MSPRAGAFRGGFSLAELMVTLVFLALLAAKAAILFDTAATYSGTEASALALEDQALQALDRIAYAVMGSDRRSLDPNLEAPAFSADLAYTVSLGVEDGVVVWDDPERITVEMASPELVWSKNPGEVDERRVVWSRMVAPLLQNELQNGVDDNGNGLIDERGLTFVLDGNSVTVTLTLERANPDGPPTRQTVTTMVTCRRPLDV